ncbi:MAG: T9SS type A sorting domain-containing protein [Ignavibacteriales bacterium]|nr:T9SS type A sorting domain-containing protein [Ignavibacteriales bacterium]
MKIKLLHIKLIIFIAAAILCLFDNAKAQWVNDPSSNTKLVIDPVDPINITAFSDVSGGAFVFWEDKKGSSNSDIYFVHINENGDVSFRADGKVVSTRSGLKENPIAVVEPLGNSIVLWKGFDKRRNPELFIQKLSKNGLRLWQNEGIQLTESKIEKVDFSLRVDKRGYTHTSHITKNLTSGNKFSVKYNVLTANGKILSDSLKGSLYFTNNTLSETEIIPDNKGGSFIFWLENLNQKTVLRLQFVDSTGSRTWGSKPLTISKTNTNVLNYSVGRIGTGIYAAVTYQGPNKIIYQQLISDKGNLLWGADGKLLTYQKGSQKNPQFAFVDSSVVVSWTNEFEKINDVFIQRFDVKGNRMWGNNGKRVINIKGNQFGQRIVYDKKNGVIIAWIDKREKNPDANLYIQKIDLKGKFVWDPDGVMIASSQEMQKSYLNLIPDGDGGAIAIFKGNINNKNNIYGQKIFSTGTYASQILGFNAEVVNDSVKISWYAANENEGTTYSIYRSGEGNTEEMDWKIAGSVKKNKKTDTNYYEFYDLPDISGSIFYRIAQKNDKTQPQYSNIEKVDYFRDVESIVLGQNYPNPFSSSTTISFFLPELEEVTFEFFNSNIEIIKKIDDFEYPAGKNEVVFNAENLLPGIYYYRLKAGNFVDVKKMIISE